MLLAKYYEHYLLIIKNADCDNDDAVYTDYVRLEQGNSSARCCLQTADT